MNPEIQPTSPLDLAGAVVSAPAAGLVEMKVLVCLGAVLICLVCVSTRLPWVLEKVAASAEKQFGPSAVYGELELELIQPHMTQKPMLRGEVVRQVQSSGGSAV